MSTKASDDDDRSNGNTEARANGGGGGSDSGGGDGESLPHSFEAVVARLDRFWQKPVSADYPMRQPGGRVGRFRIIRLIGHGSFGMVYLAYDTELRRDVALKIPRIEVMIDESRRQRFEQEAVAAAMLDHPGIVPIYDARIRAETPYIASAYCPGPSLDQWLRRRTTHVPCRDAANFIAMLSDAVNYAHQHGVLHRDLKPANVLLVPSGTDTGETGELTEYEPRLTDFGLAKIAESDFQDTRSSLLIGTPLYMAPEQLRPNQESTLPTIDVYSLGVLLFELLTRRTPFDSETYFDVIEKLRKCDAPRLRELRPDVPRDLEIICGKCLQKLAIDRYETADLLARDLRQFTAGREISARSLGTWTRLNRWAANPDRIQQASLYAVVFNSLLLIWVVFFVISAGGLAIGTETQHATDFLPDTAMAICLFQIPKIWVAIQSGRGKLWAVWIGVMAAAVHVTVAGANGLGLLPVYDEIYRDNPIVRWAAHSFLVVGAAAELTFYLFALYARLKLKHCLIS